MDGIFTADPRKVPTARLLDAVTPSEAAELTFYGSEVIHPFTMDQVIRAAIPIRIKNVKNPRNSGTVIWPDPADEAKCKKPGLFRHPSRAPTPSTSSTDLTKLGTTKILPVAAALRSPKRPTAVTIKRGITVLNVHSKRRTRAHGFLMSIFRVLDAHKLSVDLISSSEVHVSMALHSDMALLSEAHPHPQSHSSDYSQQQQQSTPASPATNTNTEAADELRIESAALKGAVDDLSVWGDVDLVPNMAIVSLVGRQLRDMVGISGRFFSTLGEEGINIEMISQGASFFTFLSLLSPVA